MGSGRHTLTKRDLLRGHSAFSTVFSDGRVLQRGPIRCFYANREVHGGQLRVGFSVTRACRTAAARNRVRRWMKESYRLSKGILGDVVERNPGNVIVVFLFSARPVPLLNRRVRESIDQSIADLLKELLPRISKPS